MELPKDFYTIQSMLTLSGSTGATFFVCNGLQQAFDFNPKWLALLVAQAIVLTGVYVSGERSPIDYFIGIVNGFLVFCSAAGATSALGKGPQGAAVARGEMPAADAINPQIHRPGRTFLSSWF
jgi:hypothetical protein